MEQTISRLLLLCIAAYAIYRYVQHTRLKTARTTKLRNALSAKAEEYKQAGAIQAGKTRYFKTAVEDDTEDGISDNIAVNRGRAREHEQNGHALFLAATVIEAVLKEPSSEKMIALMEHYVGEFGQTMDEKLQARKQAVNVADKQDIDSEGVQATFVVAALKEMLAVARSEAVMHG